MKAHLFLITTNDEFIGPKEITLAYNGVDRFTNTKVVSFEFTDTHACEEALLVTPKKAFRISTIQGLCYYNPGDLAVFHKGSITYYI